MVVISFSIDWNSILKLTDWTFEIILDSIPWWIWVLVFLAVAVNIWGIKISRNKARQRKMERSELLNSVRSIDNQLKSMKKRV